MRKSATSSQLVGPSAHSLSTPNASTNTRTSASMGRSLGLTSFVRQALDRVVGAYVLPRASDVDVQYVADALRLRMLGQANNYNFMIRSLKSLSRNAIRWISALSSCVHLLNEEYMDVVRDILNCDLVEGKSRSLDVLEDVEALTLAQARDSSYAVLAEVLGKEISNAFIILMTQLVCAHSIHLKTCIEALVKRFLPFQADGDDDDDEEQPGPVESIVVQDKILECLQLLITIVPTGNALVFPAIEETFPHRRLDSTTHNFFVRNLLSLISYIPSLETRIFGLLVERMMLIDVEVKADDADRDGESTEADDSGVFEFDGDLGNTSLSALQETPSPNIQNIRRLENDSMVEKLDTMMDVLFEYFLYINSHRGQEDIERILNTLLEMFDRVIVRTQKSKHVQYLIFYLCSFNPSYSEAFLAHLLEIIKTPSTNRATRQTCAAYMASYLARAKYLSVEHARQCLEHLVFFSHEYIDATRSSFRMTDIEQHGIFYSVCQAIFYMFCFRGESILEEFEDPKEYFDTLDIRKIVESKHNPLKVCLSSVVNEFVRICNAHGLLDCTGIVARNVHVFLPSKQSWGGQYQLETFFPFDPYALPKSRRFIAPLYLSWDEIDPENAAEEETSQKTDSEVAGSMQSYNASLDGSIHGMEMMSFEERSLY
eukprot:TRINITY_DN5648_c0_g2_i1.p1 TRINITY_DN5648_c0_g2~~TRINITY_DN5648_c0_g2_i1.p1  ORF type:complete len:657 (+),score=134.53 TRINITY_DN5648_c0_g2_i1:52-2022(+)